MNCLEDVRVHGGPMMSSRPGVEMSLATLLAVRARGGGFTGAEAIELLTSVASAVETVRRAGILEDGVNPATVTLTATGRVMLENLRANSEGSARYRAYRAPELAGGDADPDNVRSRDVFALGILAVELLTGRASGMSASVVQQLERRADVPHALRKMIPWLLTEVPAARPSLDELATTLRSLHRDRARAYSVVIADANPNVRKLLAQAIRRVSPGATIRFVADSRSAVEIVKVQTADAVFLAFDPGCIESCRQLRGPSHSGSMILCATRQPTAESVPELASLGVGHLPWSSTMPPGALVASISRLLQPEPSPLEPSEEAHRAMPPLSRTSPDPAHLVESHAVVGGKYCIERQLGEGGMGCVFEVSHRELGKRFALKTLRNPFATEQRARAQFFQEAKLASELSHASIVSVVDYGEDPVVGAYMVMELLTGELLSSLAGKLPLRVACESLAQVASALHALHRHGIIHGDIKSDNVMVVDETTGPRRRRIAQLIDFGLAHRITGGGRTGGAVAGTPEYMAPERALGGPATVATDVYSLGVVAYEILTGRLPFTGATVEVMKAHVDATPPDMNELRSQPIDPALVALVERAMHKSVELRHPTVERFLYELNAAMEMLGFARPRASRDRVDDALAQVFTRSQLPQALVTHGDTVSRVNPAFRDLVPELGALVARNAELAAAIVRARNDGLPGACTGTIARGATLLPVVILVSPLGADHVHLVLHCDPSTVGA